MRNFSQFSRCHGLHMIFFHFVQVGGVSFITCKIVFYVIETSQIHGHCNFILLVGHVF